MPLVSNSLRWADKHAHILTSSIKASLKTSHVPTFGWHMPGLIKSSDHKKGRKQVAS